MSGDTGERGGEGAFAAVAQSSGFRLERWSAGMPELPARLRDAGLTSGLRIWMAEGTLTLGGADRSLGDATVEQWCLGAARTIARALHGRRLQLELLQAQRTLVLNELTAATVHDFNNVLTGVIGFSALLCSQIPAGPPRAGTSTCSTSWGRAARTSRGGYWTSRITAIRSWRRWT